MTEETSVPSVQEIEAELSNVKYKFTYCLKKLKEQGKRKDTLFCNNVDVDGLILTV